MTDHIADIVYDIPVTTSDVRRHTLAVLVDNEFGVLARVIGLFSGRGYNIESLTVAEVEHDAKRSRITIVTSGTEMVIEQIKRLLEKMVPVYTVHDLTLEGPTIERELALVKVGNIGDERLETLALADAFRARVVDSTGDSLIFELTGVPKHIDEFIALMRPMGLLEVCRTGVTAIAKSREGR